jgi:hypothetical protein
LGVDAALDGVGQGLAQPLATLVQGEQFARFENGSVAGVGADPVHLVNEGDDAFVLEPFGLGRVFDD